MKRKIALLLSLVLLVSVFIPSQIFAAGDKDLERVIKIAKEKLSIGNNYTDFNYSMDLQENRQVWYLYWNNKEGDMDNISVTIDGKGTILNYYHYTPYNYEVKFPKISRQEAKEIADKFIEKVNPGIVYQLKEYDTIQPSITDPSYYFYYTRIVNGIPFYNDTVSIDVNRQTGKVQSYYCNWSEDLEFPSPKNIISLEEAQKAYMEKLGLRLIYDYAVIDDKINVFAAYAPKHVMNSYIDAFTGEKIDLESVYYAGGGGYAYDKVTVAVSEKQAAGPVLSPEEINAVNQVSKLLSKESAEAKARSIKVLGLTDAFKLRSANLSKNWPFEDEYTWYLYFVKDAKNANERSLYVNVTIDAKTGEVKSFYNDVYYEGNVKAKYNKEEAKAAVEAFLKQFNPDKFSQTEYDISSDNQIYYRAGENPLQYSFSYIRKVGKVVFPNNSIHVGYDAVGGKITYFDMNWLDVEFPSVDQALPLDTIYEKMFEEVGMELQYRVQYTNETDAKYSEIVPPYQGKNMQVKLVYGVKPDKPLLFDANTGVILDYSGKPYKENKPVEYTDIDGHFAEKQIRFLAEFGIALDGPEFKPDQEILQKDFFRLLSKTLNYYGVYPVSEADTKELDDMYKFLIREGIVKESEKAPDAVVSREESVKFIIRALKYDKVADIKGIYQYPFKDMDNANPDLIGYISIATGLKIINGSDGMFYPKNKLTRGQAAVIIYNYLQK